MPSGNTINLEFTYSLHSELEIVDMLRGELEWLDKNRYKINLPKVDVAKSSAEEVKNAIKAEYDQGSFLKIKTFIENGWMNYALKLQEAIPKLNLSVHNKYEVVLTSYGPGGMYNLPNKIIINKTVENPLAILVHELIHLSIERYIQENELDFQIKEKLVDLIVEKIFPGLCKQQKLKVPASTEQIFEKHFSNVPLAIKAIAGNCR